jgi:hypothetical protein
MPVTITLPVGKILTVWADENSRGSVWKLPEDAYGKRIIVGWAEPNAPFQAGPFRETRTFKIVAMSGELEFETKELIVAQLERATDRIRSATVIARALNEGKKAMSVLEKFKRLAEVSKEVPAALGDRADKSIARFEKAKVRGNASLDNLDVVIADAEASAATIEDAVNQLTNGQPVDEAQ